MGTETEIEGILFEVTPWGYDEASRAFTRLSKKCGPALAAIAQPGGSPDLARAAALALAQLDEGDLPWISELLGKSTRYSTDGGATRPFLRKGEREALFSGRVMLALRWIAFGLEVNYGDFFAAFGDLRASAHEGSTRTPSEGSTKS